MKLVVNKRYTGFEVSKEVVKALNLRDEYDFVERDNETLIKMVEKGCGSGLQAELVVIEIPDNATDWFVNNYDGWEVVYYALDGVIYKEDGNKARQ